MIFVAKYGAAWTLVGEDGELVSHRRVRAVHQTRAEACAAAQRYAALTGEEVSPDTDGDTASRPSKADP